MIDLPHVVPQPPIDTPPRAMRCLAGYDFALKGLVGTVSPFLGILTSLQEQIEWHLRIASLVVGLAVGVLSLLAMIRKLRKR